MFINVLQQISWISSPVPAALKGTPQSYLLTVRHRNVWLRSEAVNAHQGASIALQDALHFTIPNMSAQFAWTSGSGWLCRKASDPRTGAAGIVSHLLNPPPVPRAYGLYKRNICYWNNFEWTALSSCNFSPKVLVMRQTVFQDMWSAGVITSFACDSTR